MSVCLSAALQQTKFLLFRTVCVQHTVGNSTSDIVNTRQKIISYSGCRCYLAVEGNGLDCLIDCFILLDKK